MIELQTGSIHDLLPPNFKDDIEIKAAYYAMDRLLDKFYSRVEKTKIWSYLKDVPEDVADYLAAELRTPFYDAALPLETKQAMVFNTLDWYSRLGTKEVIEEIIRIVLGSGEVEEWFAYNGQPYCFTLSTGALIDGPKKMKALIDAVFQVKNTRSWLEKITLKQEAQTTLYTGIAVKHVRKNTIASGGHLNTFKVRMYTGITVKHMRRGTIPCRAGGDAIGS